MACRLGTAFFGLRIGVVEEENGHQSEGVGIDVDAQMAIGEDLGGKPIRIPVVVPGLAVDRFLCTTPETIVNCSVGKIRPLNGDQQITRIIGVRELAGAPVATGDVVAVVVRETAVVGLKQAVAGLHAGGKAWGLQQVVIAQGFPAGDRVGAGLRMGEKAGVLLKACSSDAETTQ